MNKKKHPKTIILQECLSGYTAKVYWNEHEGEGRREDVFCFTTFKDLCEWIAQWPNLEMDVAP